MFQMMRSGNNNVEYWTTIKPKASFERIVELYLKDRRCLKFACLFTIKIAQQTNKQYSVIFDDQYAQWNIVEYNQHIGKGYVVDKSGVVLKIVS